TELYPLSLHDALPIYEEKTRFLHMAAHELRTPITVVIGYLSMLSDGTFGAVPDAWRRPFETLMGKTRELNSIVTDLLEASRIEADRKSTRLNSSHVAI